MIKHFSVFYVGQIELENVGADGVPCDDRLYSNDRLIECFYMAEEMAELMDGLGYYALWGAEHHFQREGYECIPNLILLGTHLASRTKHLKFGCGFNITPLWHPIRLAEDYAMADILTRGRMIFGVGRGYQTREVESLCKPGCKWIDIGFADIEISKWATDYNKHHNWDMRILADTTNAIPALTEACLTRIKEDSKAAARIEDRKQAIAAKHEAQWT